MAKDIKVDSQTGDLALAEDGDLAIVEGAEWVEQACRVGLQVFRGEYYLDEEEGVPMFEQVLVKNPSLAAIRQVYRSELLSVPGVRDVTSLTIAFDPPSRALSVSWVVTTDLGELAGSAQAAV